MREQQDASGGFLAFIPLEYQVSTERLVQRHASALEDLKTIAVSRLMLDNFPHVKAYWIMLCRRTRPGSRSISGPTTSTAPSRRNGSRTRRTRAARRGSRARKLVRLIRDAGRTPVERDALYNEIKVYGDDDVAAVEQDTYRPVQRSRESPRAGKPLARFARS